MPDVVANFNHFVLMISPDGNPITLQKICTAAAGQSDRVFINMVATYIPNADV